MSYSYGLKVIGADGKNSCIWKVLQTEKGDDNDDSDDECLDTVSSERSVVKAIIRLVSFCCYVMYDSHLSFPHQWNNDHTFLVDTV